MERPGHRRTPSGNYTNYNEIIQWFRIREYPQLKGKIYLDHDGATVSIFVYWFGKLDLITIPASRGLGSEFLCS